MGLQTGVASILALEKRIQFEERTAELIQLKRSRNSLLNIARIPPEILSYIFYLVVTPVQMFFTRFPVLKVGSYNFLLVCHHWSEVAYRTPGLWSFWGNTLGGWKRQYLRSGTSPIDVVLDGVEHRGTLDGALQDALKDRAARDTIRRTHLCGSSRSFSTTIMCLLTPEGEGVRRSSIESISVNDVDLSNFFARHHFPKLRDLDLWGYFRISSWDCLGSRPMALVNLSLRADGIGSWPKPSPTASQILSLLSLNPNIRNLALDSLKITDDGRDISTFRVPLLHLERLFLRGGYRRIFPILRQLELPKKLDDAEVTFKGCTLKEVREVIGPYIQDYIHRDVRFKDRLGLSLYSSSDTDRILLGANVTATGCHDLDQPPQRNLPHAEFTAILSEDPPEDAREELCIEILTRLPQETVIYFETDFSYPEGVLAAMPNIEILHLSHAVLLDGFLMPELDGPNAHKKYLPSLQWLYLEDPEVGDEGWEPLIVYLAHQTSNNQAVSLTVCGAATHICPGLVEQIDEAVERFVYQPDQYQMCPFDRCLIENLDADRLD